MTAEYNIEAMPDCVKALQEAEHQLEIYVDAFPDDETQKVLDMVSDAIEKAIIK